MHGFYLGVLSFAWNVTEGRSWLRIMSRTEVFLLLSSWWQMHQAGTKASRACARDLGFILPRSF